MREKTGLAVLMRKQIGFSLLRGKSGDYDRDNTAELTTKKKKDEGMEGRGKIGSNNEKSDYRKDGKSKREDVASNSKELKKQGCHQCQRREHDGIVICSKCGKKRYCSTYISRW
ncbi:hypothetical protein AMTRI_Chr01g133790 [Amborella trichopoda]